MPPLRKPRIRPRVYRGDYILLGLIMVLVGMFSTSVVLEIYAKDLWGVTSGFFTIAVPLFIIYGVFLFLHGFDPRNTHGYYRSFDGDY